MPKVSVIIPVYNAEFYIDRCVKSVLEQTYKDMEILLMIGKCKDGSLNKCITWQKKDERIIIVSRKDTSLGDARNYGLKLAKGKYIIYVDADDYICSGYIAKMIDPLEKDDTIEVTCCGFAKYSQDGVEEQILPSYEGKKIGEGFWDYTKYMGYGVVWLRAYRKDWFLTNHIEMFDGCHEDDAMTIIMSVLTKQVFYIKEALYFYNTENSESLMHNVRGRYDYCKALAFAIDFLKRKNIYEPYRYEIRKYCINGIRGMRKYVSYNREFDETVAAFMTEYFPEVIGDINFRKQKKIELKGKIVLFGAGADGKRFLEEHPEVLIAYVVDNNGQLQNTYIGSYKIYGFNRLLEDKEKVTVIIASSNYYYDIAKQLREGGIQNYTGIDEYFVKKVKKILTASKQMFALMNTPEHSNIGDHVIAEQEKKFIKEYVPEFDFVEITESQCRNWKNLLKKYMPRDAVIAITGGGFLGSLWYENGEKVVLDILSDYADHKIIIFPQTMFYENSGSGKQLFEQAKEIYAQCNNLTIFLRDKKSYHTALTLVRKTVNCQLVPDIALSLRGYDKETEKCGKIAALCLKTDQESVLSDEQKEKLKKSVLKKYQVIQCISMFDTEKVTAMNRKERIDHKINELKAYSLVVTDALHCMILCAVSGTPCIAINNVSKKLEGAYQWIKHIPYVRFLPDINGLDECIKEVTSCKEKKFEMDYEPYFQKMRKIITECF